MICEDLDWEWGASKVMVPHFEASDNSEKFSVIDVIASFCHKEGLGEVGTRMPFSIGVSLQEDSSRYILGGICGNGKEFLCDREMKYGFVEEAILEPVEGILVRIAPFPWLVLLCNVQERLSNV